jgi:hypothetical protein
MAIKSSGQLSFTEIVAEFADTAPHSMSEFYRGGVKVPTNNTNVPTSGAISFSNFYNAVNRIVLNYIFSTNTADATVNINSLPGYVAGITDVIITVNSGVYVWASFGVNGDDNTNTNNAVNITNPALTISGSTSGDTVHLINNGFIIGKGGDGFPFIAGPTLDNVPAQYGGTALNVLTNMSITNNSYIAGGGGAGAGIGGGGAGGGKGGQSPLAPSNRAAGGLPGEVGANGFSPGVNGVGGGAGGSGGGGGDYSNGSAGGGGRILPGVGGVGGGGAGGSGNNPGGPSSVSNSGAGGGGWGAAGGNSVYGKVGGAGGRSVALNGRTVTFLVTGTRWGAIN